MNFVALSCSLPLFTCAVWIE